MNLTKSLQRPCCVLSALGLFVRRSVWDSSIQSVQERRHTSRGTCHRPDLLPHRIRLCSSCDCARIWSEPECNAKTKIYIFRSFSALTTGRYVCWLVLSVFGFLYTIIVINDYWPRPRVHRHPVSGNGVHGTKARSINPRFARIENASVDFGVDGRVIMSLIFILVIWTLVVINTELLLTENTFQPTDIQG